MNAHLLVGLLAFGLFFSDSPAQEKTPEKPVDSKQNGNAKQKKDVFKKDVSGDDPLKDISPDISILVEYISVDHAVANQLISQYVPKKDGIEEMRDTLESMLDEEKAELIDTMWIRSESGQRSKTESVFHHFYPTEYDPPEIPNVLGNPISTKDAPAEQEESRKRTYMTSGNPTAFECRNVGTTLEVDPVLSADHSLIDLNLSPEIVSHIGTDYFTREGFEHTSRGVEHVGMPVFYTMKDTTQLSTAPGRYALLGIHKPHNDQGKRVLVLLRADLISFE